MAAVYMPNASITLAWGLRHRDEFREDWTDLFPDKSASSSWVDVFYNGALVYRDLYVAVDGGRASLPLPIGQALEVPAGKYRFFRTLDAIEHATSQYETYIERAGFKIVDAQWPRF